MLQTIRKMTNEITNRSTGMCNARDTSLRNDNSQSLRFANVGNDASSVKNTLTRAGAGSSVQA
jgi:hypothetical protein